MNLRDRLRDILDTLDGIGVDPQEIQAQQRKPAPAGVTLRFHTCADYEAACKAFRCKPEPGRSNQRIQMRHRDSLDKTGELLLAHTCWPHLDCWGET